MHPVEKLIGEVGPFLDDVASGLGSISPSLLSLYLASEVDHVCYRVDSIDDYQTLCRKIVEGGLGHVLVEGMIGGRPITTVALTPPLEVKGKTIRCLEIPCPKPGKSHKEGLEHCEVVIGSAEDTPEHSRAKLEAFILNHPGVSWDLKAIDKDLNADVAVDLPHSNSVKFHLRPLYEVIEYEIKGGSVVPVPEGYFATPTYTRADAPPVAPMKLPVVDLAADPTEAAQTLRSVCLDHGFFYLKGHGFTHHELAEVLATAQSFFALPLDEKLKIKVNACGRGYDPPTIWRTDIDPSTVAESKKKRKEGICFGRVNTVEEEEMWSSKPYSFVGPNQFPQEDILPGFTAKTVSYMDRLSLVSNKLLHLLAASAGLEEHHFDESFALPTVCLRYMRYLPERSIPEEAIYAASPHCDYGMFTILLTDNNKGLQVLQNGVYVDVEPIEGLFICNLGEILSVATDGAYRATMHRVVLDGTCDRYSVPFFFEPSLQVPLQKFNVSGNVTNEEGREHLKGGADVDIDTTYLGHLQRKIEETKALE